MPVSPLTDQLAFDRLFDQYRVERDLAAAEHRPPIRLRRWLRRHGLTRAEIRRAYRDGTLARRIERYWIPNAD